MSLFQSLASSLLEEESWGDDQMNQPGANRNPAAGLSQPGFQNEGLQGSERAESSDLTQGGPMRRLPSIGDPGFSPYPPRESANRTSPLSSQSIFTRPPATRRHINTLATLFTMSPDHHALISRICDTVTPEEEFAASLMFIAHVEQERRTGVNPNGTSPPEPPMEFDPSKAFKDFVRAKSTCIIISHDLESYTKTTMGKGTDGAPIAKSLQRLVMNKLKDQPATWRAKNCPPGFGDLGTLESDRPHTLVLIQVNLILKHIRASLRSALLTNVLAYKGIPPSEPVPAKEELIVKIRRNFEKLVSFEDPVKIYEETDPSLNLRLRLLRYLTVHVHRNPSSNRKEDQWYLIDRTLAELSKKSLDYQRAYCKLVMRRDILYFDGEQKYEDLRHLTEFPIPTPTEVQAEISATAARLALTSAPVQAPLPRAAEQA